MTRVSLAALQLAKENYQKQIDRQRDLLDASSRESWRKERIESKSVMAKQKNMLIVAKGQIKILSQSLAQTQTQLMGSTKQLRMFQALSLMLTASLVAIVVL
ncbi:hypothetical protein D3C76_1120070 [compost metagenome]